MKCPECDATQRYSSGTTCRSCGYRWVFNPKKDPLMDKRWMAAIARVSGNGTYYFTDNQLYAECCRRTRKSCWVGMLMALAAIGLGLWVFQTMWGPAKWPVSVLLLLVAAVASYMSWTCARRPPLRRGIFHDLMQRWEKDGIADSLEKRITTPILDQPPPEWNEPDIYDYGFQNLLIVERDLLVDLLVLNQFHANNQTLVVAESGYPPYLVPLANQALNERPDLPVFLMHDATDAGQTMSERMSRSTIYPLAGRTMIDIGLNEGDVKRLRGLRRAKVDSIPHGAPVDLLLPASLCTGAALALESQQSLAELIDPAGTGGSDGGATASFG